MKFLLFLACPLMCLLASCGSHVPNGYTRLDYSGAAGGYKVLSQDQNRAEIETRTQEYYFLPEAELAARKAQRHFLKSAQAIARKNRTNASRVLVEEGDITRNPLAGTYTTLLTGTVVFGTGPTVFRDLSLLDDLAESSANKSNSFVEGSARAADAMNKSLQESNRNNRIDSLNRSINENTRATRDLEREVRSLR